MMRVAPNRSIPVVLSLAVVAFSVLASAQRPADPAQGAQPGNRRTEVADGREIAAGEVLFRFRDDGRAGAEQERAATLDRLKADEDADEIEPVDASGGIIRLRSRSKNAEALIRRLSARPDVLYAEPNYIVRGFSAAPNDPLFSELWGLQNTGQGTPAGTAGADIKAIAAWDLATGSARNIVAVVDTGVDYNHPDVAANIWTAPGSFTVTVAGRKVRCGAGSRGFNAITNSCDPMDDQDHGTHIAGTIGATGNNGVGVIGVSHGGRLMALKFLDFQRTGTIANAIKAIDFAIQVKAAFAGTQGANVRVLNCSWGGFGFSQAMLDVIRRAGQNDMLFVTAAGNSDSNLDTSPAYPASYAEPNVIAVAATNNRDERAAFSNYGSRTVHLAAPGESILSTVRSGSYKAFSGTSSAAPFVSGAAALVLSRCPLNTTALKEALLSSVDRIPSMSGITISGGRLNVAAAVGNCRMP